MVYYIVIKKDVFNNFNKIQEMLVVWLMVGKEKDAPLYNLKYLSKMHSIKETHQNINHGYVW